MCLGVVVYIMIEEVQTIYQARSRSSDYRDNAGRFDQLNQSRINIWEYYNFVVEKEIKNES
jgi:hypothetical protein